MSIKHGVVFTVLIAITLSVTACSAGQEAKESEPNPAAQPTQKQTQEQAARDAIAQAPRGHRGESGSQLQDMPAGQPGGDLTDEEKCQLNKVVADVGEEGARQLLQDWVLSSMKADSPDASLMQALEDIQQAQSFSSFLAERGYTC